MNIKFITDKPALLAADILVVGDLHLGIEYELYKSGFSLPPSVNKIKRRINKILKKYKPGKIVLLGDVKHNVPQISIQEKKEIPKFLEELSKKTEVHLVPGNHDGRIDKLSPKEVKVHKRSGFRIGDFYFNHGHSWPGKKFPKSKILLMGHSHPALEFKDSLGYRYIEPCWLRSKLDKEKLEEKYKGKIKTKEAIIIPSINPMISGMPVNRGLDKPFIGPLMRKGVINIEECKAYLLDGTYLGKVGDL